jgi:hypothetical protein
VIVITKLEIQKLLIRHENVWIKSFSFGEVWCGIKGSADEGPVYDWTKRPPVYKNRGGKMHAAILQELKAAGYKCRLAGKPGTFEQVIRILGYA